MKTLLTAIMLLGGSCLLANDMSASGIAGTYRYEATGGETGIMSVLDNGQLTMTSSDLKSCTYSYTVKKTQLELNLLECQSETNLVFARTNLTVDFANFSKSAKSFSGSITVSIRWDDVLTEETSLTGKEFAILMNATSDVVNRVEWDESRQTVSIMQAVLFTRQTTSD